MICLDTNIAIYVINRRVPAVRHRLAEQLRLGTDIGLPAIALFELRYGHARSDRRAESDRLPAEVLAPGIAVLPVDAGDGAHARHLRASLASQSTALRPYHRRLAAQGRLPGRPPVTCNGLP